MKIFVFGNIFKLFRLAITFAREVYHLVNKDEDKYDNGLILLINPNRKPPVYEFYGRVFIAAEKWMVRTTGVGGLISLQNGNLRLLKVFRRRYIFCFVKVVSIRERQMKLSLMNRSSLISPRTQLKIVLLKVLTVFALNF